MKICSKCKRQYESGNFCEDCENEDGSPVRLEEEKVSCPRCGRQYKMGTKFCSECGVRLGESGNKGTDNGGISMGDKNVIAGDVIGKKEEYKISGNATIVHSEDETKKTAKCHICGSVVQRISGYDCPDCGEFTCEECFDKQEEICKNCVTNHIKNKEQQYKMKVIECLSNDNRIDAGEFNVLTDLAQRLGISAFRASEIQNEVRNNSAARELTTFEKLNFDKAAELYYEQGKAEEALKLVEPIYENHNKDEKILNLYLPLLAEMDEQKAESVIASLQFDCLSAYLASIIMAIRKKDLNTAEQKVQCAVQMWPDSTILKCHRILYRLALYEYTKDREWLDKAAELIPELGEAHSKLELSWQVKVQCMVNEAKGEEPFEMDREFCKQNQLYYSFMKRTDLLSKKMEDGPEKAAAMPYDMVFVEVGSMTLGGEEEEYSPEHEVELDSFYISKYEVTQELYKSVTGENPSNHEGNRLPVEKINWYDAIEFCNKLSEKEGLKPYYSIDKKNKDPNNENEYDDIKWTVTCSHDADGYRLPTEAEWEYAARGGQKSRNYKYAGSDSIDEVAWYAGNFNDETHEVGKKKPNELGLYDMSGNVGEWCWDWYGENPGDGKNPAGPDYGIFRVVRGGGCFDFDYNCRVVCRNYYFASSRDDALGFRLCRSSSK